jgi:hypothetical protein
MSPDAILSPPEAAAVAVRQPTRDVLQRGDTMTVIGYHDVKDQKHWLASPMREKFFGPLGVTNIRKFIDPTNPKRVAIMMDVPDMAKLLAAMQSPGAAEAMANDGVVAETLVMLVEA